MENEKEHEREETTRAVLYHRVTSGQFATSRETRTFPCLFFSRRRKRRYDGDRRRRRRRKTAVSAFSSVYPASSRKPWLAFLGLAQCVCVCVSFYLYLFFSGTGSPRARTVSLFFFKRERERDGLEPFLSPLSTSSWPKRRPRQKVEKATSWSNVVMTEEEAAMFAVVRLFCFVVCSDDAHKRGRRPTRERRFRIAFAGQARQDII